MGCCPHRIFPSPPHLALERNKKEIVLFGYFPFPRKKERKISLFPARTHKSRRSRHIGQTVCSFYWVSVDCWKNVPNRAKLKKKLKKNKFKRIISSSRRDSVKCDRRQPQWPHTEAAKSCVTDQQTCKKLLFYYTIQHVKI